MKRRLDDQHVTVVITPNATPDAGPVNPEDPSARGSGSMNPKLQPIRNPAATPNDTPHVVGSDARHYRK